MGFYSLSLVEERGVVFEKRAVGYFRGGRHPSPRPCQTKSPASKAFHAVVLRTITPGVPLYGYRYLSTELGRWVSRDPIGERGGCNLFVYLQNKPINANDLHGLVSTASCKDAKDEFFDDYSQWQDLLDRLGDPGITLPSGERRRCKASFDFRCCDNGNLKGRARRSGRGRSARGELLTYQVRLCCNNQESKTSTKRTLVHELTHFVDFCYGADDRLCADAGDVTERSNWKCYCKAHMCMEMRARRMADSTRTRAQIWEDMKHYFTTDAACSGVNPSLTDEEKNAIKAYVMSGSGCQDPWNQSGVFPSPPDFSN